MYIYIYIITLGFCCLDCISCVYIYICIVIVMFISILNVNTYICIYVMFILFIEILSCWNNTESMACDDGLITNVSLNEPLGFTLA